jgi:hypothetical protein
MPYLRPSMESGVATMTVQFKRIAPPSTYAIMLDNQEIGRVDSLGRGHQWIGQFTVGVLRLTARANHLADVKREIRKAISVAYAGY